MLRVFFLGAGASVPDGFPVTSQLMGAVANFVTIQNSSTGRLGRLFHFLNSVYGFEFDEMQEVAKVWKAFEENPRRSFTAPQHWPSITDVLTTIDIAIADGFTLGTYARPNEIERRQVFGNELNRIRRRLVEALGQSFKTLHLVRSTKHIDAFAGTLELSDVVVTTNWDALIDFSVHKLHPDRKIEYGLPSVELVDFMGNEIPNLPAAPIQKILKLHGSMNWLACPRCGKHYANLEKVIIPTEYPEEHPRSNFRLCDICDAELSGVIETPTLIKAYGSGYVRSLWLNAIQALVQADTWIFCGYSLPSDDAWIATLLLRALTSRLDAGRRSGGSDFPRVVVYASGPRKGRAPHSPVFDRFEKTLRRANLERRFGGFESLISDLAKGKL